MTFRDIAPTAVPQGGTECYHFPNDRTTSSRIADKKGARVCGPRSVGRSVGQEGSTPIARNSASRSASRTSATRRMNFTSRVS